MTILDTTLTLIGGPTVLIELVGLRLEAAEHAIGMASRSVKNQRECAGGLRRNVEDYRPLESEVAPAAKTAALSGPTFAIEVAREIPTAIVTASSSAACPTLVLPAIAVTKECYCPSGPVPLGQPMQFIGAVSNMTWRGRIHLVYIYSKREQLDLTPEQKKEIAALVDILKKAEKKR